MSRVGGPKRSAAGPTPPHPTGGATMTQARTRREFLRATAPLALAALPGAARAAGGRKAPVVDTHLHCFAGKDDRRFPYHARAPYRPDAAATPQRLLELMD